MNREIKFRAWHLGSGEMLEWDKLKQLRWAIESETVVVMQYTGLKDKNGVEIYEGDCGVYKTMNNKWNCRVEFNSKLAGFEFVLPNGDWIDFQTQNFEVTGNIFEEKKTLNL